MTISRSLIGEQNPEALFIDGHDDALIGMAARCGQPVLAVYSYGKIRATLMERDGMEQEEAEEFMEFNILGSWLGAHTPIVMEDGC